MAAGKSKLVLAGLIAAAVMVALGVMDGAFLGFMQGMAAGYALAIGAVLAVAGWVMAKTSMQKQAALVEAMQRLAKGDLSTVVSAAVSLPMLQMLSAR